MERSRPGWRFVGPPGAHSAAPGLGMTGFGCRHAHLRHSAAGCGSPIARCRRLALPRAARHGDGRASPSSQRRPSASALPGMRASPVAIFPYLSTSVVRLSSPPSCRPPRPLRSRQRRASSADGSTVVGCQLSPPHPATRPAGKRCQLLWPSLLPASALSAVRFLPVAIFSYLSAPMVCLSSPCSCPSPCLRVDRSFRVFRVVWGLWDPFGPPYQQDSSQDSEIHRPKQAQTGHTLFKDRVPWTPSRPGSNENSGRRHDG